MPRPSRPARLVPAEISEGVIPTGQRLRRLDGATLMDRRGVTVDTAGGMTYRFFPDGGQVGIWAGCHYVKVTAEEAIDLGHELLQTGWDVLEART